MPWLKRFRSLASADQPSSSGRFGLRASPAKHRAALTAAGALTVSGLAALLAQLPAAEAWRESLLAGATAGAVAATAGLLTWLVIPGLAQLTRQELARRRQLFHVAYQNAFADPTAESLAVLLATQSELELSDDEIGAERAEVIHATLDLFAFHEQIRANGGELPPAPRDEVIRGPERCVFTAEALLQQGSAPERGRVVFTGTCLSLHASVETRVPWGEIVSCRRDGTALIVQALADGPSARITLPSLAAAMRAEYIAGALRTTIPGAAVF